MSAMPLPRDAAADRHLVRRVRKALAAKERSELRPAFWAGLTIFVGLPLLWSVLLILLDSKHRALPGIATLLGLCGGWIFAAIVAAQTVCRDFGRAPGVFLSGLPVSRGQIVEAKAGASFRLILLLTVCVVALELVQMPFADQVRTILDPARFALAALLLPLIAWFLAFVAASITRNTLTAVVISVLCLALISALPLVSTWTASWLLPLFLGQGLLQHLLNWAFARFVLPPQPQEWDWQVGQAFGQHVVFYLSATTVIGIGLAGLVRNRLRDAAQRRKTTIWRPLLLISLFCFLARVRGDLFLAFVFVSLLLFLLPLLGGVVSKLALRSERGLRLSMRMLVSAIAVLVVGLFLLAMREVGATGRVAFTHWDNGGVSSVAAGTQFTAITTRFRGYELFRSSDHSAVDPQVRAVLPVSGHLIQSQIVLSERDACGVVQMVVQPDQAPDFSTPRALTGQRWLSFARIDAELGTIDRAELLPLPARINSRNLEPVFDAAMVDDNLFVMLCMNHPSPQDVDTNLGPPSVELLRYRFASPPGPPQLLADWEDSSLGAWPVIGPNSFHSPSRGYFARGCDGRMYVARAEAAAIDVLEPPLDNRSAGRFYPDDPWWMFASVQFPVSSSICAVSNQSGLSLIEEGIPGDTLRDKMRKPARLLGELRASPWAWLFRAPWPTLLAGRKNQLWEIHAKSAICYDVSDPARPRRILHVQTYPITGAASGTNFLVLSHGPGFSIVHHPRQP